MANGEDGGNGLDVLLSGWADLACEYQESQMFRALAEGESFTKAARMNGVTLAAVSLQVSALEKRMHWLLVDRSRKKFRLTREGRALYDWGKEIMASYATLQNRLQGLKDLVPGSISVATIYSMGHDLPLCLQRLLKCHPTVQVSYRHAKQVYEEDTLSAVAGDGVPAVDRAAG